MPKRGTEKLKNALVVEGKKTHDVVNSSKFKTPDDSEPMHLKERKAQDEVTNDQNWNDIIKATSTPPHESLKQDHTTQHPVIPAPPSAERVPNGTSESSKSVQESGLSKYDKEYAITT